MVAGRGELTLPTTNQRYSRVSIVDEEGINLTDVVLDDAGNIVDEKKAIETERIAKYQRFGNASESLGRWLESAPQDEVVEVALAVRIEDDPTPWETLTDKTEEESQRIVAARVAVKERALAKATRELKADLDARGWVTDALPTSGVVHAKVKASDARLMAKLPLVRRMVPAASAFVPRLNYRLATRWANQVHNRGIRGAGATIGLLEVGGGRVTGLLTPLPNNGALPENQLPPPLWGAVVAENGEPYSSGCGVNDHAIAMLGVMASKSGFNGFAYGGRYAVSGMCATTASSFLDQVTDGMTWLVRDSGARVINASWGGPTLVGGAYSSDLQEGVDRDFDRFGYTQRVTLVAAAGQGQGGYLDSPAKAFNVIAVGAFDDKGTTDETDGVVWNQSSWRNPTSLNNDRQKPEIIAPGVGPIYSVTRVQQTTTPTGAYCWECSYFQNIGSGTSVATAFTSGVVGLLFSRDSRLKYQPEAVRAILLAASTERPPGSGAENYGAGGIFADYADDMAAGYVSGLDASAATAAGATGGWIVIDDFCRKYPVGKTARIPLGILTSGRDVHAVAAWGVNPDSANSAWPDQPELRAQLAACMRDALGKVRCSNAPATRDQNYSLLWHNTFSTTNISNAAGVRELRVTNVDDNGRCSAPNVPLAIAWHIW